MDNHVLEERVLEKVMRHIPLGLVVTGEGRQRKVYYVNHTAYRIMGYTREEFIQKIEGGWGSLMDIAPEEIIREHQTEILKGEPFEVMASIKTKNGKPKWLLNRVIVCQEAEPVCYISFMDVTEKVEQEQNRRIEREHLKERARRDSYTKLLNRGTMEELIDKALEEADGKMSHAYIALDVDNFKQINDIYGHCMGDRLILELAALLTKQFRKEDYVGRMGGDEFSVFVKNVKNPETVKRCAERILEGLRKKKGEMGLLEEPSVSIGIAFYPESGQSFRELYHKADEALYKVKNDAKNGIAIL